MTTTPPARHRLTLTPKGRYRLATAVTGHGWYQLAPVGWDPAAVTLTLPLAIGPGRAASVRIRPRGDRLAVIVDADRRLTTAELAGVRRGLVRALQLDVDLAPFWAVLRARRADDLDLDLGWVEEFCAGHLLQSPTLFEDLLKILLTTNCSWSFTRTMCSRLVAALGDPAPDGSRAFPTAGACAAVDEGFWRDELRIGYRAPHAAALARGFADGRLTPAWFEDPELPDAELERRLLALPGFGPYAVGHALRGLGRCRELAIDSWCRARAVAIGAARRAPSDAWFARKVRRFAPYEGLALWFWLVGPDGIRPAAGVG